MKTFCQLALLTGSLILVALAAVIVPPIAGFWADDVFETEKLAPPEDAGDFSVLLFSKTNGFRHPSIVPGRNALQKLGAERGWSVFWTESGGAFHADYLRAFDVVVWLSTTGDVLTAEQEVAFEAWVEGGGGYVGIHSASDTEYEWSWYARMMGAHFDKHTMWPHTPEADMVIEDRMHPATAFLPERWRRADEWYAFRWNPRENVRVLASLDESSFDPNVAAMGDHPIIWSQEFGQGRSFYTGIGHTAATFREPLALRHLAEAVEWAGRRAR